jgi:hypothetical protein
LVAAPASPPLARPDTQDALAGGGGGQGPLKAGALKPSSRQVWAGVAPSHPEAAAQKDHLCVVCCVCCVGVCVVCVCVCVCCIGV